MSENTAQGTTSSTTNVAARYKNDELAKLFKEISGKPLNDQFSVTTKTYITYITYKKYITGCITWL